MKLLKCVGVLIICMSVAGFIALAGGSQWGHESMGWMLTSGVVVAGIILSMMIGGGKL